MQKTYYTTSGLYKQVHINYWIVTDSEWIDYFIFKRDRNNAFSWDTVEIKIKKLENSWKKAEAEISKILQRWQEELVCVFMQKKWQDYWFARVYNTFWWKDIYIYSEDVQWAKDGDIVLIKIKKWIDKPVWIVTSIMGKQTDKDMQEKILLQQYAIRTNFNEKVIQEAKNLVWVIWWKFREDLTREIIVTIDWEDAKDLDDAISVKRNSDWNYELGVHIADVAEYVKNSSHLDTEAKKRWTSIYLPWRVIPMLPKDISDDLCSLNPKTPKATLSILMVIDASNGKVLSKKIKETLIHSKARLTYNEVWEYLSTKNEKIIPSAHIRQMLEHSYDLFKIVYSRRKKEWKIEFDFPEVKVEVDTNGKPISITKRQRNDAHRLIEEFMILANEEVSKYFSEKKIPFLYRVHEKPSEEWVFALQKILSEYGIPMDAKNLTPLSISHIIDALKWRKEEYVLSKQILTSMSKAKYLDLPLWHFGLSLKYYSHFTSPIRRYPDLQIHRIIKEFIKWNMSKTEVLRYQKMLWKVANMSSTNEQKAEEVERKITHLKTIEYMESYVWTEFEGRVSWINANWLYIELDSWVEWFVLGKNLDLHFAFDETKNAFFNSKTKKALWLWDYTRIKVAKADKSMWFLDFELLSK
ncbi:MAG: hypothetical protein ACD_2C00110G0008 [uncultured bacterium (gcode 4)]|uniref:exoribonuclease II n=1 Tax=uncultured bacterium (gcode 4) TaxID=1234023 RepID=K2G3F0_9BACT|nr:MAG: hypothetical protein ACD_2C00110G0008 [uncultured bacterium (gcode 4)]